MEEEESNPWLALHLRKRAGHPTSSAQVAEVLDRMLRQIDGALSPVIGRRGVALLYKRALFLSAVAHPWMAGTERGINQAMDFTPLRSVLEQQADDVALSAGSTLLQGLYDLLTSLVGLSLTEQLLRCVWANPSSGLAAQDIAP